MDCVIGADLAWKLERNSSALAVLEVDNSVYHLTELYCSVVGHANILRLITSIAPVGLAIDAPLRIPNSIGMRDCERELNAIYRAKWAGCHPANQRLYPDSETVALSTTLLSMGYQHLGSQRWQIECYPHPSLIELCGLPRRLAYKHGTVAERKRGQIELAGLIDGWRQSGKLMLTTAVAEEVLDGERILSLAGAALKHNEDALDAIICAVIAGCYYEGRTGHSFGSIEGGHIWVPRGIL